MIVDVANLINESPYVIILGFISSIFGLIEMIISSINSIKTHKNKNDNVDQSLKNSAIVSSDLNLIQSDSVVNNPKTDVEVNISLSGKEEYYDENSSENESDSFFRKISNFFSTKNARDLIFILFLGEIIVFFTQILFGDIFAKLILVTYIFILYRYADEKYIILRSERVSTIINCYINVGISIYFLDIIFSKKTMQIIVWALMVFVFFHFRKISSIVLDVIGPFMVVPFWISAMVFTDYDWLLVNIMIIVQIVLVAINVRIITKETILLLKQSK
ncbi:MAG: hypothetical protein IKW30_03955 [Lachnospiraceae bacterium]|nr:hypothetical protein [Lachnospiraceae bacterium]